MKFCEENVDRGDPRVISNSVPFVPSMDSQFAD
jgi:hypothetical protein